MGFEDRADRLDHLGMALGTQNLRHLERLEHAPCNPAEDRRRDLRAERVPHAVLDLRLVLSLTLLYRDALLAIHRIPRDHRLGDEDVLLAARDEDARVTVRLDHHLRLQKEHGGCGADCEGSEAALRRVGRRARRRSRAELEDDGRGDFGEFGAEPAPPASTTDFENFGKQAQPPEGSNSGNADFGEFGGANADSFSNVRETTEAADQEPPPADASASDFGGFGDFGGESAAPAPSATADGDSGDGGFGDFGDSMTTPQAVDAGGVEAGGEGVETGEHAAPLNDGEPGVLHGALSYLMQDEKGQVKETKSVSAGLDYPGVGPEHSWLKDSGRAEYVAVSDQDALRAFHEVSEFEGIIPALETAHAFAYLDTLMKEFDSKANIIVNVSGRGDKDINTVAKIDGIKF